MRRAALILRVILGIFAAVIIASCGPTASTLDRVAPPVRFGDLRETASWCPGFRNDWWQTIDRLYAEYDRDLDALVASRWDALAVDVSIARTEGRLPTAKQARAQWAQYQQVVRELGDRELALISAIDHELPIEADVFIALLRARVEFRRACGMLCEPGEQLPGPLEVLALDGRGEPNRDIAVAATAAYTLLCNDAREAARTRVDCFIEYCKEKPLAQQVGREAAAGVDAVAEVDAARRAEVAVDDALTSGYERAFERFRVSMLHQQTEFAQAIADDAKREDYLSRVDAFLYEGVRSVPAMRSIWQVGRRLLERSKDATPDKLARFDEIYQRALARQAALRPNLRSNSKEARAEAYAALVDVVTPLRKFLDAEVGPSGLADKIELQSLAVAAGKRTAEQAVDALQSTDEVAADARPVEPALFPGRDRGMQLLLGAPLRESVLLSLAARLRLSPEVVRGLVVVWEEARDALRVATEPLTKEIGEELRALGDARSTESESALLRRFMSSLRAKTERVRELDRAANERMLTEIARVAAVPADDERIAIARVELSLLCEIGADRGMPEAEGVGGLTAVALVNPFEVVRSMGADEGQRATSESIVHARADELLAAHREARAVFELNIRALLGLLLHGEFARKRGEIVEREPWRPRLAGMAAAQLRFRIADDLRAAQGDMVARAYLTRLRELAEPTIEPQRSPAFGRLDRFGAGIGMNAAQRAASDDLRAVVAELLDQADERRESALHALLRWRSQWIAVGGVDSRERWRELARVGPTGWLLRSRVDDADERAIAQCAALIELDDLRASDDSPANDFPLNLPARLRPYFK